MKLRGLLTAVALVSLGCAHAQKPERRIYVISEGSSASDANDWPGTGGAGADAYCNDLQIKCHNQCMRRKPRNAGVRKGSREHDEDCTTECLKEFMKCLKRMEDLERQEQQRELQFENLDGALRWLREHKTEVVIGTVVVVAGVAFVVATGGSGALLLAPLAL
jgi:hypothetical protein